MLIPDGFEYTHQGGRSCILRRDVRSWLEPVLHGLGDGAHVEAAAASSLFGGRGGAELRQVGEHRVVIRPCRRGGLPARLVRDLYFGLHPRPFAELTRTEQLRHAGVPVAEIYAALVRWVMPGCYRGWVISGFLADTETLWQWAQQGPDHEEKKRVWGSVALALRRLHAAGVVHPDLNLNNILVRKGSGPVRVWLLDFDRSLTAARMGADIQRLERSVHKLDAERAYISADDFAFLRRAYAEAPCA